MLNVESPLPSPLSPPLYLTPLYLTPLYLSSLPSPLSTSPLSLLFPLSPHPSLPPPFHLSPLYLTPLSPSLLTPLSSPLSPSPLSPSLSPLTPLYLTPLSLINVLQWCHAWDSSNIGPCLNSRKCVMEKIVCVCLYRSLCMCVSTSLNVCVFVPLCMSVCLSASGSIGCMYVWLCLSLWVMHK